MFPSPPRGSCMVWGAGGDKLTNILYPSLSTLGHELNAAIVCRHRGLSQWTTEVTRFVLITSLCNQTFTLFTRQNCSNTKTYLWWLIFTKVNVRTFRMYCRKYGTFFMKLGIYLMLFVPCYVGRARQETTPFTERIWLKTKSWNIKCTNDLTYNVNQLNSKIYFIYKTDILRRKRPPAEPRPPPGLILLPYCQVQVRDTLLHRYRITKILIDSHTYIAHASQSSVNNGACPPRWSIPNFSFNARVAARTPGPSPWYSLWINIKDLLCPDMQICQTLPGSIRLVFHGQ